MTPMTPAEREALLPEMPEPDAVFQRSGNAHWASSPNFAYGPVGVWKAHKIRTYALAAADAREAAVLDRLARAGQVERPVRPRAWLLDGTQCVEFDQQAYHAGQEWEPLYDQAKLDAAVAAEREHCIAVVRSTPNGCALADNRAYVERFRSTLLAELAGAPKT